MFKFDIREGRDISTLSLYRSENEVLLLPNSTFTVSATLSSEEVSEYLDFGRLHFPSAAPL